MPNWIIWIISLTLVVNPWPHSVNAHEGHHHEHQHEKAHAHETDCCHGEKFINEKNPPANEREAINRVLDIFHFAIDGEHEHKHHSVKEAALALINPMTYVRLIGSLSEPKTWKQIRRNSDIPRVFNDAYKAYKIETQQELTLKHAKNMIAIYPLSHATEMAAAPVFLYGSQFTDLSTGAIAGITAFLGTISLPGLDILCIIIFATYPLKAVHKPIGGLRRSVEWIGKGLWNTVNFVTGVNKALSDRFKLESGLSRIERVGLEWIAEKQLADSIQLERNPRNQLEVRFLNPTREVSGQLLFDTAQETHETSPKTYLSSMRVERTPTRETELLRQFIRQLGPLSSLRYNVSRHIKLAQKKGTNELTAMDRQFYINAVRVQENDIEYSFEDRAINVSRGVIRNRQCVGLFL